MEESTRHRQHRCRTPPRECVARVGSPCPGAPRKKKPDYRSTSPQYLPPGRLYQCYADYDERSPTNNNRDSNDHQDDIGVANNNLDDITQQRSSATLMRRQAPPLHHHHHRHPMLVDIEPRRLFDNYHDDSPSSVSRALYHGETTLGSDFFQLRLLNEDDEQNDAGRRNPVHDNDDQRTR